MPTYEYLRVPNFVIPPDGDVALGGIFHDLKDPTTQLNPYDRAYIPDHNIKVVPAANFNETDKRTLKSRFGINASILQTLGGGGDLIYSFFKETNNVYHCDRLDTKYFNPDKTYIEESIRAQDVRDYIEASAWRNKTVYMITGLKIATGFTVNAKKSGEQGGTIKVGVDATSLGVPVGLGVEGSLMPGHSRMVSYEALSNIVLAYRAIKIQPRGDGTAKYKTVTTGALYSQEDDEAKQAAPIYEWEAVALDEEALAVEFPATAGAPAAEESVEDFEPVQKEG